MRAATYETYSTLKRGTREVRLLRAEVGYDRERDQRLFRYGVQVPSRAIYEVDMSRADAIAARDAYFAALPVPDDNDFVRSFVWGTVLAVHRIGDYQIIEFIPNQSDNVSDEDYDPLPQFHPYIMGDDTNRSYLTLERALIGVITYRFDPASPNERADTYFARMIELPERRSLSEASEPTLQAQVHQRLLDSVRHLNTVTYQNDQSAFEWAALQVRAIWLDYCDVTGTVLREDPS